MSLGWEKSKAAATVIVVLPVIELIVSSSVNSSPGSPKTVKSLVAKETLERTERVSPPE